ncbi:DUF1707 SHOCT-like domain-containing protein [Actinomadura decatromicini]|uniref:DUF1707 SHOCT-like domain-containing protein n=1 Tax=Actinomadura decatromicini TaxID=2604572 RepID=UPI001FE25C9C|nr:DUF1707 domain-containing protein [Actinomadura decatromicini]
MIADPPGSPALRASDADRDQVIGLLRGAVADGRLDPVEFEERLDAALNARTIDALTSLTTDLIPAPGSGRSAPRTRGWFRSGPRPHARLARRPRTVAPFLTAARSGRRR